MQPARTGEDAVGAQQATQSSGPPVLEVVVPVYNEEAQLARSIIRLRSYLDAELPGPALVTVADNGSTDGTWLLALKLAQQLGSVRAVRIEHKGRGGALRKVWSESGARVVAYMDVDLSTDLRAIAPLVSPLLSGEADIAIGSRLASGAYVRRSLKRTVISRAYNVLVRASLGVSVSDAQCGFKAGRCEVVRELLGLVADDAWFFDTELVTVAQLHGLRVHEVPVRWVEDPDSRVKILRTAWQDLVGIRRLRKVWGVGRERPASGASRRLELASGHPIATAEGVPGGRVTRPPLVAAPVAAAARQLIPQ